MQCVSVTDLRSSIDQLKPGDWFIVDIDDTVITPQAMMFRSSSPFHTFIDDIKKEAIPNLVDILSTWRLNRRVMLVEQEWPQILNLLKNKGVTVLALTQVHSGTFGKIQSMEKWRANELESLGITFSPLASNIEILINEDQPSTFYRGIIFTGSHPKSSALQNVITKYGTPSKILFLDDRLYHVEALEKLCKETNIPFEGYYYLATNELPYVKEKDYGLIQMHILTTQHQWIEDEEAQKIQQ